MFNLSKQEKITFLFLIAIALIIFSWHTYSQRKNDITIISATPENEIIQDKPLEKEEDKQDLCIIHISGAVNKPGVYQLNSNARIIDAVKIAGGEKHNANIHAINLAAHIYDGQKINIPYLLKNDEENPQETINNYIETSKEDTDNIYLSSDKLVNLNSASSSQLETLPGIGPVLAQRILEHRKNNGLFSRIEDLMQVAGIGEKRFESVKELITAY